MVREMARFIRDSFSSVRAAAGWATAARVAAEEGSAILGLAAAVVIARDALPARTLRASRLPSWRRAAMWGGKKPLMRRYSLVGGNAGPSHATHTGPRRGSCRSTGGVGASARPGGTSGYHPCGDQDRRRYLNEILAPAHRAHQIAELTARHLARAAGPAQRQFVIAPGPGRAPPRHAARGAGASPAEMSRGAPRRASITARARSPPADRSRVRQWGCVRCGSR